MCCVFTIKMMFPINRGPQNPLVYILLTFRWFWRGKISRHAHMYYTYYILIGKKRCAINMTWWKVLILDHPEAAKKGFQENEHLWVLWLTRSFWKHQQEGSTWNFWTLLPWPLTHFHIHMRPSALPRAAAMRYCSPPSVKGINTSRAAWKGQKRNSLISTLSTISTIHHHFFCTLILSDHFVLIASCCALKKRFISKARPWISPRFLATENCILAVLDLVPMDSDQLQPHLASQRRHHIEPHSRHVMWYLHSIDGILGSVWLENSENSPKIPRTDALPLYIVH